MLLYKIEFEVDDGAAYTKDVALVNAHCIEDAEEKLRAFINAIDSETCIYKIYNTAPFKGEIFTGRHGWK